MKKILIAFTLSTLLALATHSAWAAPVDLGTWVPLGDASVTGSSAKLTTAFSEEGQLAGGALFINDLESQLGIASGTLGVDATEGSAQQQSFTFTGRTRISFNWVLGTENFDAQFADLAFALVDGNLVALANAASADVAGLFSYTLDAGPHTFAFGVVDINDFTGVSTLSVSNVDVSPIPEPGTATLLLLGLGSLALMGRRRQR